VANINYTQEGLASKTIDNIATDLRNKKTKLQRKEEKTKQQKRKFKGYL